jgi:PAS domain S-box-containing protein
MEDPSKTKQELIEEIGALKQRIQELEQSEATRRQTEEARQENDRRFRSLVEETSDWVWEIDSKGFFTYASSKVKDLLGYEPEEVIGKSPFVFMPADERERISALFKEFSESRQSFSGLENINLHKNGHKIVLETSGRPLLTTREIIWGIVALTVTSPNAGSQKRRCAIEHRSLKPS